jgi:transcriptional regulator with XRE-family HTH domain
VSKWENGVSYPDIVLVPKIAEYFGVSIDFLFGKTHNTPSEHIETQIINYLSEVDNKQRYPLAHSFFRAIFDGVSGRMLNVQDFNENRCPAHAMDRDEGLALLSFKGLGALIE